MEVKFHCCVRYNTYGGDVTAERVEWEETYIAILQIQSCTVL